MSGARRRRGRRVGRHTGGELLLVVLAPAAAAWWLAALVVRWWPLLAVVGGLLLLAAAAGQQARSVARRARLATLRLTLAQLDALNPTQFEFAVRDLLARDGYAGQRVGGAGDAAADVIARGPAGRLVVQCKHTTTGHNVGVQVMYQVNGTAGPVHHADAALVVTNGRYTGPARAFAAEHRIALIDREALARWAQLGHGVDAFLVRPRAGVRRVR